MRFLEIKKTESINGYEWYLYISDEDGPLTGIFLDKKKADGLVDLLSKSACEGAPWPVYEESMR